MRWLQGGGLTGSTCESLTRKTHHCQCLSQPAHSTCGKEWAARTHHYGGRQQPCANDRCCTPRPLLLLLDFKSRRHCRQ
jgi:hypothetical protein